MSINPKLEFATDSDPVVQDMSGSNFVFIHSKLDEIGLNPSEFRVYCHFARRVIQKRGTPNKAAFPSVDTITRICQLHPNTVRKAIKSLSDAGFIKVQTVPGYTNRYLLPAQSEWMPENLTRTCSSEIDTPVSDCVGGGTSDRNGCPTQDDTEDGYQGLRSSSDGNPKDALPPAGGVFSVKSLPMKKAPTKHNDFIARWKESFLAHSRSEYVFSSTRDFRAVKELVANEASAEELIELAKLGWVSPKNFVRDRSRTIYGFAEVINTIQIEANRKPFNNHNI